MLRFNALKSVALAMFAGFAAALFAGEPAPPPPDPAPEAEESPFVDPTPLVNPAPDATPFVDPAPRIVRPISIGPDPDPLSEPVPLPLAPGEIDLFAPRGLSFGKLTLFPAFNYELTYTDNAARAQRNADGDILHEYQPSLDLRLRPNELISYDFLYEFGWHDYAHDEAKDYLSHRVVTEVHVRNILAEGMYLKAGDAYLQSGNTSALENELLSFTRFHSNRAYMELGYRYNRFAISGRYTHSFTDYFARAAAASDYLTHSGELNGEYAFVPERLILFGLFNFSKFERNVTNVDDFDTHTLMAGVKGRWSKLTYSVSAGYSEADFINRDQHSDGPAALGSLIYQPHRRLTFGLTGSRRFVGGALQGISIENNLAFNAAVQITERGRFTASYQRNESDREDGPRLLAQQFDAGFEWKLTRFAALRCGGTHTERENSSGTGEYIENQARVGFRFSW